MIPPPKPGEVLIVVDEQGRDTGLVAIWNPKPKPKKRPTHLRLVEQNKEPS